MAGATTRTLPEPGTYSTKETAARLGVNEQSFRVWRRSADFPLTPIKVSRCLERYSKEEVERYLAGNAGEQP